MNLANMQDDEPSDNSVALGRLQLTGPVLKGIALVLALFLANHIVRLTIGATSWFGMQKATVREAPNWMNTPVSDNLLVSDTNLSLPMPAQPGQDIVIKYDLESSVQNATAPRARILVSCVCPAKNWEQFSIDGPGRGELVMPVKNYDFYTVTLYQSAGLDGTHSLGTYWWGVRSNQSQ
jgi:hypothetical protein